MQSVARTILLATTAVVTITLAAPGASAQGWGPAVQVKDIDARIRDAADRMGMIRTRALVIGQVNLPVYVANGTMVDLEAPTLGQPVPVTRYDYAVAVHSAASRFTFEGPQTPSTTRVVKGSRAWNEAFNADKTKLDTSPADAAAALRAQLLWVQPHAFIHAAAFASGKRCLDGKACTTEIQIKEEGGKTVIELPINGRAYKGTMGADKRPERIETTVTLPGGAARKLVATFHDWRTGETPDAGYGTATGKGALDKFHSGVYWPSRLVHELDGTKVLDLTLTEGWANPYQVFPDPELLAKAQ